MAINKKEDKIITKVLNSAEQQAQAQAQAEGTPAPVQPTDTNTLVEQKPLRDVVTLPATEYKSILERLGRLERGEASEALLDEPQEHFVTVRMLENKPVVDVGSVFALKNDDGDEVLHIDVIVQGKDGKQEKMTISYRDFTFKLDKVKAKITQKQTTPKTIKQGLVEKKEVRDWKTIATGLKVPVKVLYDESLYLVELPDKSVVQLTEEAVN